MPAAKIGRRRGGEDQALAGPAGSGAADGSVRERGVRETGRPATGGAGMLDMVKRFVTTELGPLVRRSGVRPVLGGVPLGVGA